MKKWVYVISLAGFFVVFMIVSFLTGSRYSEHRAGGGNPSEVKAHAGNAGAGAETGIEPDPSSLHPGTVRITTARQQLIGVKMATVEKAPWSAALRVPGRIVPDETRLYRINSATDGWVKKILPITTGSLVKKDQLLATFFAPEFFSALKAYLYGLRSLDRFEQSGRETKEQLESTGANIDNYRNSLRNLGMTEHQLDEIRRTRQSPETVEIRAPEAGFILVRNLTLGQRFERGTELYRIADLSKVWILADVFEYEAQYLEVGKSVQGSLPNQKKTFQAKVSNVLPQFDEATRTLKVRLEADNPNYALRPNMFVDIELPVSLPPAVTVPADAVLDSGLKKTVFIDKGSGLFEPREVETGWRLGNRVEITRGLEPGERIVISGTFLIDSESRMELAATGMFDTLAKDPVCGMDVSPSKAEKTGRRSRFQGKSYYFCSDECKEQFDKSPERYAERSAERSPSAAHHMASPESHHSQ